MDMEITTIMKHTIILFQSQELLLTINHIIIKVNQVIYILSIIQETARSKRKMHIFTYHIKVSIYTIEGGNLAASKIRNLECPSYEICLIDYGCGKFNRKIHIMEQYP